MITGVVFLAHSKNYFRKGTKWITESRAENPFDNTVKHSEYYFSGTKSIGNKQYLIMWHKHEDRTSSFEAYIYSENDKVYIYNPDDQSDYLIYDFGLQEGDTTDIIYSYPPNLINKRQGLYHIKCTKRESTQKDYCNKIHFDGFHDFSIVTNCLLSPQFWIDGIGSLKNPLINLTGIEAGNTSFLKEVIVDGKTIYKSNSYHKPTPMKSQNAIISRKKHKHNVR